MTTFELFINICAIASNIAIVITMIYGIIKLRQDKRGVIADLEWRRKNETIRFSYEVFEEIDNLLSRIKDKFQDETINVSDLQKDENAEMSKIIFKYLSLMERLSVGLNTDVYDLDVYARICRSKTVNAWKQLENIVERRRKDAGNELIYKEFETMVGRLNNWSPKPPAETRGNYKRMK